MRRPRLFAAAVTLIACASACSSGSSSAARAPSALTRWAVAYDFLAARTKPTQISCGWFDNANGTPTPAPRAALFFDVDDRASWKDHAITRNDVPPAGVFEDCEVTVPTSVPYSATAIAGFLQPLGLSFAADPDRPAGLTSIEIAYAGQDASDPDVIYRGKPGLFGLRIALAQLGDKPFEAGTSKVIPPRDEQTAQTYLRYAKPLLDWYGFTG